METVVEGRLFIGGQLINASIGIDGGRIVEIGRRLKGEEHLDFKNSLILPGAIDPHVHFRDPGATYKEDFRTGSLAAAHAGVTCVMDMPNTSPPTTTITRLLEKSAMAKGRSYVDYGLFAALTEDSDVRRLALGAVGFKLYMGSTTGDLLLNDDEEIAPLLEEASAIGKVVSVHAEDDALMGRRRERNAQDHLLNRPEECEVSAIERLARVNEGARINICHISSLKGLTVARKAGFTSEATLHHLLLDASLNRGAFTKVNPPLRGIDVKDALFQAFLGGGMDMIGSDHAPHSVDEKELPFDQAPSGMPGVETTVPILLAMVKRERLPMHLLVRCACQRPAEVFGLNKGEIAVGKDADLMVVDPRKLSNISAEELYSKAGWSPYEGVEALFPEAVFLRGRQLIEDGELIGDRKGRDVVLQRDRD